MMKDKQNRESDLKGFGIYQSNDNQYLFKVGIIDFLTEYGNIKFLENKIKSVQHNVGSEEISAIDETRY